MMHPLLPTLHLSLDISKPSRPAHFSLRIRLLSWVVVAGSAFPSGSVRLGVLAWDLRLAGFLRVGWHIAGWRRCLVGSAGGYAGEGAQGEGREALLGEGGAAEGHDGCLGNEGDGCGLH